MRLPPIGTVLRAPAFWDERHWLSDAALPLAAVYAAGLRLRNAASSPPVQARAPVVCVGSPLVGGAGKTPAALAILLRLKARRPQLRAHALARGYGGSATSPMRVDPDKHCADVVGDEPLLLATLAPTWVGARRCESAALACAAGAELLLMDDGLQHHSLQRDLSFMCVDTTYVVGNGRLLPAGPLREPLSQTVGQCGGVIAITPPFAGHHAPDTAHRLRDALELPPSLPVIEARMEVEADAAATLAGRCVLPFSGTARPGRFFDTLLGMGCRFPCAPVQLPDHARLEPSLLAELRERAARHGARLVTTSKDAVRIRASERGGIGVLPVALKWAEGAEDVVDDLIDQAIARHKARAAQASPSSTTM